MSVSIAKSVDRSTNAERGVSHSRSKRDEIGEIEEFGQSIGYLLGAISNILLTRGSRFYRQNFGIGLAEWRLMWVLGIEPAITARRASQIIGVDKAAISRAVAGLERRGLLQAVPDPADNRQRLIRLSPIGNDLYHRMIQVSRDRQRQVLAPLSDKEQRVLAGLLRRLHAHLASGDELEAAPARSDGA